MKTKKATLALVVLCTSASAQAALAQAAGHAPASLQQNGAMASGDLGETTAQLAARQKLNMLVQAGTRSLTEGRFAVAEAEFRDALSTSSSDPIAYAGLAESLTAQGRRAEAIQAYRTFFYVLPVRNGISSDKPEQVEAYRQAVYKDPTRFASVGSQDISIWMNYAILLSQTGQWPEAVNIYEKALPRLGRGSLPRVDVHFDSGVSMPDQLQAAAHLVLGIDASNRLEHDKALKEYNKALQLQPDSGLINFYYGYGLQRLGRKAQANAAFQKTVKMAKGEVKAAAEQALKKNKKPV